MYWVSMPQKVARSQNLIQGRPSGSFSGTLQTGENKGSLDPAPFLAVTLTAICAPDGMPLNTTGPIAKGLVSTGLLTKRPTEPTTVPFGDSSSTLQASRM